MAFSEASEAKLTLVEGYKANAIILYNIIQQARTLEHNMMQIHNLEVLEKKALAKANAKEVILDEKKVSHAMKMAIMVAGNLTLNTLEFLRRLKNEEIAKLEMDRLLKSRGIPKDLQNFMEVSSREEINTFEKILIRIRDVSISLIGRLKSIERM